MFEMMPHVGIGSLKLGMSIEEVAALLGPPTKVADPSTFSFLRPERKAMYKGQIYETRKKHKEYKLVDITYANNRVVVINVDGKADNVGYKGIPLAGTLADRLSLLNAIASHDAEIYVKAESYLFLAQGIVISRPSNRKDINYGMLVESAFQRARLEFEFFKPHVGPIVP